MSDTSVDVKRGHEPNGHYLGKVVNHRERQEVIQHCLEVLRPIRDEFDAIVGTGCSGLTMGATLAYLLDKNFVIVRKDGDRSHSGFAVEGNPGYSYVIVDDLVCSGKTMQRILATMERECGQRPKCLGALLFVGIENPLEKRWLRDFRTRYGINRLAKVKLG